MKCVPGVYLALTFPSPFYSSDPDPAPDEPHPEAPEREEGAALAFLISFFTAAIHQVQSQSVILHSGSISALTRLISQSFFFMHSNAAKQHGRAVVPDVITSNPEQVEVLTVMLFTI